MQNQTIFELYTDDDKSKYSSSPKDILKSEKKNMENPKQTSTGGTTKVLSKIHNRRKDSIEHFNLCEEKISLDEIIKSINSKANDKFPGKNGLTAEFYKY